MAVSAIPTPAAGDESLTKPGLQSLFRVRTGTLGKYVLVGPDGLECRMPMGKWVKRARFEIDGQLYLIENRGRLLKPYFVLSDARKRLIVETNQAGFLGSINRLSGSKLRVTLVPAPDGSTRLFEGDTARGLIWMPEDGLIEGVGLEWLQLPVAVFVVWLGVRHYGRAIRNNAV